MGEKTPFVHLLEKLVTQFGGTKQDLAKAINVTPFAFSRLLAGNAPSLEICLRLATATETSASKVLRAAGKADVDGLIQKLYGPPAKVTPRPRDHTPLEEKRLKQWRALPTAERKALTMILAHLVDGAARASKSA